jgi:hypothetical protein
MRTRFEREDDEHHENCDEEKGHAEIARRHGRRPMIEDVDARVREWLTSIADGAAISFALPVADSEPLSIYAYLFDVDRPGNAPSGRTPPMVLRLKYLIAACGPDPVAAHALLGKIIAAADTDSQYTLEFGAAASAAWAALNLPVRASVVLSASASKDRSGTLAPFVRTARVQTMSLEPLSGRVVAGNGVALVGAVVEVPALGKSATCDATGRFTLDGLSNALDLEFRVRVKGLEKTVQHPAESPADFTIVVDI